MTNGPLSAPVAITSSVTSADSGATVPSLLLSTTFIARPVVMPTAQVSPSVQAVTLDW